MKGNTVNPLNRPYLPGYPSQGSFRHTCTCSVHSSSGMVSHKFSRKSMFLWRMKLRVNPLRVSI